MEAFYITNYLWGWPLPDGSDLILIHMKSFSTNDLPQEQQTISQETTLL